MAEDSDGLLTAVLVCDGDLRDPDIPRKFRTLLGRLTVILDESVKCTPTNKKNCITVNKVNTKPKPTPLIACVCFFCVCQPPNGAFSPQVRPQVVAVLC